jgi:hypothetical protein
MDEAEKPRNWINPTDIDSIKDIKKGYGEPFWKSIRTAVRANTELDLGSPYSKGGHSRNNFNTN